MGIAGKNILIPIMVFGNIFLCLLGAYVDAADHQGSTPLHIAAQYGQELLLSVLLKGKIQPAGDYNFFGPKVNEICCKI